MCLSFCCHGNIFIGYFPVPNVPTRREGQEHAVRRVLRASRGEGVIKAFHGIAPNPGAFVVFAESYRVVRCIL